MIRKLQKKFVFLSMGTLFLVLVLIIGGINCVNYNTVVKEADEILELLSHNEGKFPKEVPKDDRFGGEMHHEKMSPELPYETRFFSVLLNKETGATLQTDTGHISAVDSEAAVAMSKSVYLRHSTKGFAERFRYYKVEEGNTIRIIFLDCGRKLDSFQSFLIASTCISLIGYFVVFLIIAVFSYRIIRPISESYEKQKRFITDAGHEIKTPLTIINADTDVLEMEFGENEWIEDIKKQSKRLTQLTKDLIFLARMEEADKSMTMIDFPVSDVVSEAAGSFSSLAQAKKIKLTAAVQPMLSMHGSESAIEQLVGILMDNALKYSPEGGEVRLSFEQKNKALQLCVWNETANELPKENLKMLFERFYRVDPSRNSQTGGYGIGLSVAKAITEAHGGKIQASSQDGCSLFITVIFPIT